MHIDADRPSPHGQRRLFDVAANRDARRVDETIQPPVIDRDPVDHRAPVGLVRDVEYVVDAWSPFDVAGDRHAASAGDGVGHDSADAVGGPRYKDDLVAQAPHGLAVPYS